VNVSPQKIVEFVRSARGREPAVESEWAS
jgi:hypothetical protein